MSPKTSGRLRRPFATLRFATLAALLGAAFGCSGPDHPGTPPGEPTPDSTSTPSPDDGSDVARPGYVDIALHVEESASVARHGEPVRSGIPIPRGAALTDASKLEVTDAAGHVVPSQIRATSRWEGAPDDATKPLKWVLVDFQADVDAGAAKTFRLKVASSTPQAAAPLVTEDAADHVTIATGAATFTVSKTRFNLFDGVTLADGTKLVTSDPAAGAFLVTPAGARYTAAAGAAKVSVEENGPLHAVIVAKGKHQGPSGTLLDYTVRMHFYRDRADSLVSYTFTDRDLPKITQYVAVDELGLTTPVATGAGARWTFGGESADASGPLAADAWQRQTGNLDAAMSARFNPGTADTIHWAQGGEATGSGGKAPGWADLSGAKGGLTAAVQWYWQQYPKKLDVTPGRLTVDLWPKEDVDMRVYSAAQKTHEVLFAFHGANADAATIGHEAAARMEEPLFARANPSWYAKSWVWNRIGVADGSAYPDANRPVVDGYFSNLEGTEFPATWITRRFDSNGAGHCYSMWDFGDGRESDWSNLAYDTPRDLLVHWAITGDRALLDTGVQSAMHLRDVDIEHSPLDTRAGITPNRGVAEPWLGRTRYTPTGSAQSHDLGYAGRTAFGFEHHKGQGLADHYFLTGDMLSKEVLAESYHYYDQWKVDADSGYLRTDGTRVVSHMLLVLIGYYDAYGTDEAKGRIEYAVRYLDDWQRRKTSNDPNGWMWMSSGDSTASFMNGVTAESLMLYEVDFPDGIPVKQNLIDAAKWSIDPKNGVLVNGSQGKYFNAWRGDNYGVAHATVLDPMEGPLLAYASDATGDPTYVNIAEEVLTNSIAQDQSTPFIKAFTEQTRLVPAFLWFLQTDTDRREGAAN